jgi:hypothetical protein
MDTTSGAAIGIAPQSALGKGAAMQRRGTACQSALERHGRLDLSEADRALVLAVSAATIDRMLRDVRIAARGGRRRRAGFSSAVRREVPVRTFDDWSDPPAGFREADLVAHGGMSVTGSFIQTLTLVDVATGWTECFPLLVREGRWWYGRSSGRRACSPG